MHMEAGAGGQRRALVVGCGFIGRRVVRELAAGGHRVSVLTRGAPPLDVQELIRGRLLIGDAADPEVVGEALEGIDEVVYCASGLLPATAERQPQVDIALTLDPLRTLAHALCERPATLTYLSSGGTVYGNPASVPVGEDAALRPIGAYGKVRVAAETMLRDLCEAGNLRARILRCANVYGPHQPADRGQGAVAVFLDRVAGGMPICMYGDGGNVRDYVHVDDVSRAVVSLMPRAASANPEVVNVGSGKGNTTLELLELVERTLGRRAEVIRKPARRFDVREVVLDIARLRSLVPYAPLDLEEGVRRTAARHGLPATPAVSAR